LAYALAAMGALLGWLIQALPARPVAGARAALQLLLAGLPALMGAESAAGVRDEARPVATQVEVDAPPETVGRHGVSFSELPLPGGRTRLTGTTWYRHEISPSWYWRPWSDAIIHRIHARVLAHVKALSEARA